MNDREKQTGDGIIGVMRPDGDRRAVRFERSFDTTQADLWSALTEPACLCGGSRGLTGICARAGSFEIVFDEEDPSQRTNGTILECRPPEHLLITWSFVDEAESFVEADLAPDGRGTRLVLEHRALPVASTAGYGAGWETFLEALQADLDGELGRGPSWDERWQELKPSYDAALP